MYMCGDGNGDGDRLYRCSMQAHRGVSVGVSSAGHHQFRGHDIDEAVLNRIGELGLVLDGVHPVGDVLRMW